ncbi:hypothetical protein [Hymenobacter chitinivorans]|uniref:Uncharacterized protein n=1 Tax=Hymenobacter chitinivorans DSM 11115 TaxID=1121954 RepID=A0A2M9B5Q1_9BACT|nr:hypothetical protein [Hymenobacter chitinivorans]PJJ53274.1 hypothetical protein CLV45_3934 [Hymenobacter chitinivorans DSM 11115]
MAKDKKKSAKKGKDKSAASPVEGAVKVLRKFRKTTRAVGKLSTGQKIVGGVALLAAGLTYLAKKHAEEEAANKARPGAEAAEAALASLAAPAEPRAVPPAPAAEDAAGPREARLTVSKPKKRR